MTSQQQGTNMSLAWFGATGVTYQLLGSSDLVNWQPYGSAVSGSNSTISVNVPVGSAPQMFYVFKAVY